jgi:electron transfer flavoprotein alpha subunit
MANILVIAEHDDGQLKLVTLSAIAFAGKVVAEVGGSFDTLILGESVGGTAQSLRNYGASSVLVADHALLKHPLGDKYAQVIADVARQRGSTIVVGAASTFSKDILPRAAALLDAGMLSDVVDVRRDGDDFIFKRVLFAGNAIATVKLDGVMKFLTVRSAAFAHPVRGSEASPVETVAVEAVKLPVCVEYGGREAKVAGRPDSTEARIVVSGGRAIKNAVDFERLIGGLADVLGGAVGSSRALVDAGITPNSLQVGQTGKIVAPDLYIAVGISGAIQHLAGMKDTKIIVAINKDPDAPIFEVADFGLVGDAYQLVPELIGKLQKQLAANDAHPRNVR